jgi:hypothetical protein
MACSGRSLFADDVVPKPVTVAGGLLQQRDISVLPCRASVNGTSDSVAATCLVLRNREKESPCVKMFSSSGGRRFETRVTWDPYSLPSLRGKHLLARTDYYVGHRHHVNGSSWPCTGITFAARPLFDTPVVGPARYPWYDHNSLPTTALLRNPAGVGVAEGVFWGVSRWTWPRELLEQQRQHEMHARIEHIC